MDAAAIKARMEALRKEAAEGAQNQGPAAVKPPVKAKPSTPVATQAHTKPARAPAPKPAPAPEVAAPPTRVAPPAAAQVAAPVAPRAAAPVAPPAASVAPEYDPGVVLRISPERAAQERAAFDMRKGEDPQFDLMLEEAKRRGAIVNRPPTAGPENYDYDERERKRHLAELTKLYAGGDLEAYLKRVDEKYPGTDARTQLMKTLKIDERDTPTKIMENVIPAAMAPVQLVTTGTLPAGDKREAVDPAYFTPVAAKKREESAIPLAEKVEAFDVGTRELGDLNVGPGGGSSPTSVEATASVDATNAAHQIMRVLASDGGEDELFKYVEPFSKNGDWLEAQREIAARFYPKVVARYPKLSKNAAEHTANMAALQYLAALRTTGSWTGPIYVSKAALEGGEFKRQYVPTPALDVEVVGVGAQGNIILRAVPLAASIMQGVFGTIESAGIGAAKYAEKSREFDAGLREIREAEEMGVETPEGLIDESVKGPSLKNEVASALAEQAALPTEAGRYAEAHQLGSWEALGLSGLSILGSVVIPGPGEVAALARMGLVGEKNVQSLGRVGELLKKTQSPAVDVAIDKLTSTPGIDRILVGESAPALRTLEGGVESATKAIDAYNEKNVPEAVAHLEAAELAEQKLRNANETREVPILNAEGEVVGKKKVATGTAPMVMEAVDRMEGELTTRFLNEQGGVRSEADLRAVNALSDTGVANALNRLDMIATARGLEPWSQDVNLATAKRRMDNVKYSVRYGAAKDLRELENVKRALEAAPITDAERVANINDRVLRGSGVGEEVAQALNSFDYLKFMRADDVDSQAITVALFKHVADELGIGDNIADPRFEKFIAARDLITKNIVRESNLQKMLDDVPGLIDTAQRAVMMKRELRSTAAALVTRIARRTGGKVMSLGEAQALTEASPGLKLGVRDIETAPKIDLKTGAPSDGDKLSQLIGFFNRYQVPREERLSPGAAKLLSKATAFFRGDVKAARINLALIDAVARNWSDATGRPSAEWWRTRIGDIRVADSRDVNIGDALRHKLEDELFELHANDSEGNSARIQDIKRAIGELERENAEQSRLYQDDDAVLGDDESWYENPHAEAELPTLDTYAPYVAALRKDPYGPEVKAAVAAFADQMATDSLSELKQTTARSAAQHKSVYKHAHNEAMKEVRRVHGFDHAYSNGDLTSRAQKTYMETHAAILAAELPVEEQAALARAKAKANRYAYRNAFADTAAKLRRAAIADAQDRLADQFAKSYENDASRAALFEGTEQAADRAAARISALPVETRQSLNTAALQAAHDVLQGMTVPFRETVSNEARLTAYDEARDRVTRALRQLGATGQSAPTELSPAITELIQAYRKVPVNNFAQYAAREVMIVLLKGDTERAMKRLVYLQSLMNDGPAAWYHRVGELDHNFVLKPGTALAVTAPAQVARKKWLGLFAGESSAPRGFIEFVEDNKAVITGLESRDPSTFIHEVGHLLRSDLSPRDMDALVTELRGKGIHVLHDNRGHFVPESAAKLVDEVDSAIAESLTEVEAEVQVKPATAVGIKADSAIGAPVASFKTAKGSTYDYFADQTSTRNKAARPDVGHEGDSGPKKRSAVTVFATPDAANALALPQGASFRFNLDPVRQELRLLTRASDADDTVLPNIPWGSSPTQIVKFTTTPEKGLIPIELWRGTGKDEARLNGVHFGNEIVEVTHAPKAEVEAPVSIKDEAADAPERVEVEEDYDEGYVREHGYPTRSEVKAEIKVEAAAPKGFTTPTPDEVRVFKDQLRTRDNAKLRVDKTRAEMAPFADEESRATDVYAALVKRLKSEEEKLATAEANVTPGTQASVDYAAAAAKATEFGAEVKLLDDKINNFAAKKIRLTPAETKRLVKNITEARANLRDAEAKMAAAKSIIEQHPVPAAPKASNSLAAAQKELQAKAKTQAKTEAKSEVKAETHVETNIRLLTLKLNKDALLATPRLKDVAQRRKAIAAAEEAVEKHRAGIEAVPAELHNTNAYKNAVAKLPELEAKLAAAQSVVSEKAHARYEYTRAVGAHNDALTAYKRAAKKGAAVEELTEVGMSYDAVQAANDAFMALPPTEPRATGVAKPAPMSLAAKAAAEAARAAEKAAEKAAAKPEKSEKPEVTSKLSKPSASDEAAAEKAMKSANATAAKEAKAAEKAAKDAEKAAAKAAKVAAAKAAAEEKAAKAKPATRVTLSDIMEGKPKAEPKTPIKAEVKVEPKPEPQAYVSPDAETWAGPVVERTRFRNVEPVTKTSAKAPAKSEVKVEVAKPGVEDTYVHDGLNSQNPAFNDEKVNIAIGYIKDKPPFKTLTDAQKGEFTPYLYAIIDLVGGKTATQALERKGVRAADGVVAILEASAKDPKAEQDAASAKIARQRAVHALKELVSKKLADMGADALPAEGYTSPKNTRFYQGADGASDSTSAKPSTNPFYSGLERIIEERIPASFESKKGGKSAAAQAIEAIKKSPLYRAEEDKWVGLTDWLRSKEGQTRIEASKILDFVKSQTPKAEIKRFEGGAARDPLHDRSLGSFVDLAGWMESSGDDHDVSLLMQRLPPTLPITLKEKIQLMANERVAYNNSITQAHRRYSDIVYTMGEALRSYPDDATAFSSARAHGREAPDLPPTRDPSRVAAREQAAELLQQASDANVAWSTVARTGWAELAAKYPPGYLHQIEAEIQTYTPAPSMFGSSRWPTYHLPDGTDQFEILISPNQANKFNNPHFHGETGTVHIRGQKRVVPDGKGGNKTILELTEIQNDWAQSKKAQEDYVRDTTALNAINTELEKYRRISRELDYALSPEDAQFYEQFPLEAKHAEVYRLQTSIEKSIKKFDAQSGRQDINITLPEYPHKASSSWVELGLKTAIRKAAEDGIDEIRLVSGEDVKKIVGGEEGGQLKFYNETIPDVMDKLGNRIGARVESAPSIEYINGLKKALEEASVSTDPEKLKKVPDFKTRITQVEKRRAALGESQTTLTGRLDRPSEKIWHSAYDISREISEATPTNARKVANSVRSQLTTNGWFSPEVADALALWEDAVTTTDAEYVAAGVTRYDAVDDAERAVASTIKVEAAKPIVRSNPLVIKLSPELMTSVKREGLPLFHGGEKDGLSGIHPEVRRAEEAYADMVEGAFKGEGPGASRVNENISAHLQSLGAALTREGKAINVPVSPEVERMMEPFMRDEPTTGPFGRAKGVDSEVEPHTAVSDDHLLDINPELRSSIERTGTIHGALSHIAENSTNAWERELARVLSGIINQDAALVLGDVPRGAIGVTDLNGAVRLHPDWVSDGVVLHEAIHHATMTVLHRVQEMGVGTDVERAVVEELEHLRQTAVRALRGDEDAGHFGFTDTHEFVAEVLSNPEFLERLGDIPTAKRQSIGQQILSALHKLIAHWVGKGGTSSVANEAVKQADRLLQLYPNRERTVKEFHDATTLMPDGRRIVARSYEAKAPGKRHASGFEYNRLPTELTEEDLVNPVATHEKIKADIEHFKGLEHTQNESFAEEIAALETKRQLLLASPEHKAAVSAALQEKYDFIVQKEYPSENDLKLAARIKQRIASLAPKPELETRASTAANPETLPPELRAYAELNIPTTEKPLNLGTNNRAASVVEDTVHGGIYQSLAGSPKLRAGVSFFLGIGADEDHAFRAMPPEARRITMSAGVRPIQEYNADISRLVSEWVRDPALEDSVFAYLNGEATRFGDDSPTLTSGGTNHTEWAIQQLQARWNAMTLEEQQKIEAYVQSCGRDKNGLIRPFSGPEEISDMTSAVGLINKILKRADYTDNTAAPGDAFINLARQSVWHAGSADDASTRPQIQAWFLSLLDAADVFEDSRASAKETNPSRRLINALAAHTPDNIKAPHHAAVLLGTYGGMREVGDAFLSQSFGVTREDAQLYARWRQGLAIHADAMPRVTEMAKRYGLEADFTLVPELDVGALLLPRETRIRIQQELLHGRRLLSAEEKLGLQYGAKTKDVLSGEYKRNFIEGFAQRSVERVKNMNVFGNLFMRAPSYINDTQGLFEATGAAGGLATASRMAARRSSTLIFTNVPGFSQITDSINYLSKLASGPGSKVAKLMTRGRMALSKAADASINLFSALITFNSANRNNPRVVDILEGGTQIIETPNGPMTRNEVRAILRQEGVFATFERGQMAEALFNEGSSDGNAVSRAYGRVANSIRRHRYETNYAISVQTRVGNALAFMEMGYDPRTAGRLALMTAYDYVNTSSGWDKHVIYNIFFPFQSFRKNNSRFILNRVASYNGIRKLSMATRLVGTFPQTMANFLEAMDRDEGDRYGVDEGALSHEARNEFNRFALIFEEGYAPLYGANPEKWPDIVKRNLAGTQDFSEYYAGLTAEEQEFLSFGYGGYENVPTSVKAFVNEYVNGYQRDVMAGSVMERKIIEDQEHGNIDSYAPLDWRSATTKQRFGDTSRFQYEYMLNRPSATIRPRPGTNVNDYVRDRDAQRIRSSKGSGTDSLNAYTMNMTETNTAAYATWLGCSLTLMAGAANVAAVWGEHIFDADPADIEAWHNDLKNGNEYSIEPSRTSDFYGFTEFVRTNKDAIDACSDPERAILLGNFVRMAGGEDSAITINPALYGLIDAASLPLPLDKTVVGGQERRTMSPAAKALMEINPYGMIFLEANDFANRTMPVVNALSDKAESMLSAQVMDAQERGETLSPAFILSAAKAAGFNVSEVVPSSVMYREGPEFTKKTTTPE